MSKVTITAPIRQILPIQTIPSKSGGQPFVKREVILDESYDRDGKHYESLIPIEFIGDDAYLIDKYAPGMKVTVDAYLQGRPFTRRDNTPGIILSLRGKSVTMPTAPAPFPPQQPQYPQQQQYPPQGQQYPPQCAPGVNDLPFNPNGR